MPQPGFATTSVQLSVITPSYNMLEYLKRCCASVADQRGPSYEHIVVDGGSTDGTIEWLRTQPHLTSIVGPDDGMYDAINKGLRVCRGDIVSYLSCDEQYLPGTLAWVRTYFERHPEVDGIFGSTLVTRPDGMLLCYRKAYRLVWQLLACAELYVFPSSMFVRRRIIDGGDFFDPSFKDVGDSEFVIRLLRKGYRLATTRRYLSAFTITGTNRSQNPIVHAESARLEGSMPRWISRARIALHAARLLLKLVSGAYFERSPLTYAVYVSDVDRIRFEAHHPRPVWRLT